MTAITSTATPWLHASDGGPVRFTIRGGFCQECQAGPLHPYADDPAARYVHRDDADQLAANAAERNTT